MIRIHRFMVVISLLGCLLAGAGRERLYADDAAAESLPDGASTRFGTLRWRTGSPASALAIAKGNKYLASASGNSVVLWDIATGKELRSFEGITRLCRALAFSPDGKFLAAGDDYGPVFVWETETGKEKWRLEGHASPIYTVVFSPDGKTLATGGGVGNNKKFCLWNVAGGKKLHEIAKYADGQWLGIVGTLAFSPDGKSIAAQTEWGQAGVWDVQSGNQLLKPIGPQATVLSHAAFEVDGKSILVFQGSRIRTFDFPAGKETRQFDLPLDRNHAWGRFAFSPNWKLLVAGGRPLRFFDWPSGKEVKPLGDRSPAGSALAFAPEGDLLATAGYDGAIYLIDISKGKLRNPTSGHTSAILGVAATSDGNTIASIDVDYHLHFWDRKTGRTVRTVDLNEGKPNYLAGMDLGMYASAAAAAFTPDGKSLISGFLGLKAWDVATGLKSWQSPFSPPTPFAISVDGKRLAISGWDRVKREYALIVADTASGQERKRFAGHRDANNMFSMPIRAVAIAHDGKTLASADDRGAIKLWDSEAGSEIRSLEGNTSATLALAFARDGRTLLSTHRDGSIRQWSVRTGKLVRQIPAHQGSVTAIALSHDGRRFVSTGDDRNVIVWEMSSGQKIRTLTGHQRAVATVAILPDASAVVSGSKDTTAIVWDLSEPRDGKTLDLDAAWESLASKDADKADRAIRLLSRSPELAIPFLSRKLRPVEEPSAATIKRLIDELQDDNFKTREKADKELARFGELAWPALEKYRDTGSADFRIRIDRLIASLEDELRPSEGGWQTHRALGVLEAIGTPEARRILADLAKGASGARATLDAKQSLQRVMQRLGLN